MGLHAIDNQDEDSAMRLFNKGKGNCSPYAARRCAEALTLVGNVQSRVDSCIYLINKYKDDDALLLACKELERDEEYAKIITFTDSIDFINSSDELIKIRLESMLKKDDSRFEESLYNWLISKPCGNEQNSIYQLYENKRIQEFKQKQEEETKNIALANAEKLEESKYAPEDKKTEAETEASSRKNKESNQVEEIPLTPKQQVMEYRISVYRKNFAESYRQMSKIIELFKSNNNIKLSPQILSDMGKAALYGTETLDVAARRFEYLANQIRADKEEDENLKRKNAFFAYFYAARCYDKAGGFPEKAKKNFISAMDCADDDKNYDNALWYMLSTDLRLSTDDVTSTLKKYASTWHTPAYFDDIFDSLSVDLVSHQEWQNIINIWKTIDGYATDETTAKYAYLSGRVLEEKLAECADEETRKEEINNAFTRALSSGSEYYYKILAAERLNLKDEELEKTLLISNNQEEKAYDKDAEYLLAGYAAFGFPQKIYPEWLHFRTSLGTSSSIEAAAFLQKCGMTENQYVVQSLRIASRALNDADSQKKDLMKLSFPQLFNNAVHASCTEKDVTEYEMYALIRGESFFDTDVISHAGASGLTQLMSTTASDVAKRLHISTYDMNDAYTNIKFGAYYLNDLTRRLDGSQLLALFAYNAGITHVRSWMKAARDDYAKTGRPMHAGTGISIDLFLETIPFSETREYGRKLVSASALYGWLYYQKSTNDVVSEMMK